MTAFNIKKTERRYVCIHVLYIPVNPLWSSNLVNLKNLWDASSNMINDRGVISMSLGIITAWKLYITAYTSETTDLATVPLCEHLRRYGD